MIDKLLSDLRNLPPVLDGTAGPVLVRADDVADVVERLQAEADRIAARLERYARLKRYTWDLEKAAAAQRQKLAMTRDRLAAIGAMTTHG